MNSQEIQEAISAMWSEIKNLPYKERGKIRMERESKLMQQWKDWLWGEYGYDLPDGARDMIFDKAWKDGHSSSYYQVESYYEDLCDFSRSILVAAMNR